MFINCHSHFSFKYGTQSVDALISEAKSKKLDALALTDINSTAGVFPFIRAAQKAGIHPVIGIDFRNGTNQQYIGLAKNQEGFFELNEHLSHHLTHKRPFHSKAPAFEHSFVIYPFAEKLFPLRENEYVGIHPSQFNRLLTSPWFRKKEKLVLLQPATFSSKIQFNAHRLLRSIDLNTLLSKLPVEEQADQTDQFYSYADLIARCENHSYLLVNAQKLLEQCQFSFYFQAVKNKRDILGSDWEDFDFLRQETFKGAIRRYPNLTTEIHKRIEKELELIQQKGFVSYFLINYDIVTFAQHRNFYHVGRGSGANSIVAYCLGITDVDPIELDLYFERFINLYRENPPDFDIDFSWTDRDEVTDYIFRKYNSGKNEHVALLGSYSTFQYNSMLRELGKVFGLPKTDIESLIHFADKDDYQPDQYGKLIIKYSQVLHDMPSHLTIHACGILISHKPIHYFTATEMPPKGFPLAHIDMHTAEDIGLHKFDILSQRGLGHIKSSLEIIYQNQGVKVDIREVEKFKKDPRIKEHLSTGHTIGAFYVESPAMRMLLAKMKANTYLELVAASSIIRPGVARSGMMREYILRHVDENRRKVAHPVMWDIMPETYGIMVYQEDVIKVAHYFAGLSLGEADVLRRGMSGKSRSKDEFQRIKERYFNNCKELGREEHVAKEVWHQIESFAGYSFAKGHSASFAVESYQSLYLKAYFPLEFMVGVINNFGGFYHTEFYVHELRMNGANIQAPHLNESEYLTRITGKTVFLGLIHMKYLEKKTVEKLLTERRSNGPFLSLEDFVSRVEISLEQLIILIRVTAFRFTGKTKQELLWEAHFLQNKRKAVVGPQDLFRSQKAPIAFGKKPPEVPTLDETDIRQEILDQIDILEFPLDSPFHLIKDQSIQGIKACEMTQYLGKQITILGYLVTVKYTRTVKGDVMHFGTFLDRDGDWIDTVHFPPVAKKYPFKGRAIYKIQGKVVEEFDFYSIEVNALERMAYWNAGED
ncbi:DNA polymerase III subunit alpha [Algoriphagus zhangzhouensis]|uniref:DNA-directed DNA polymerase n=1 Tax=Algoriphagus zhangzhouensis TaxID=1073327 RepID=A0A1M7Z6Z7_9BACT|nr:PHP domain-containing protein [Algoriphagus zhangzhouensis]TDY49206.1 DNA polymerase III alpha subunit [Algoriphagus zhangzhouensis]SHO60592.1 DNA polymerase-3 subunit alpha [Algoriphagus zhangzhouensis]